MLYGVSSETMNAPGAQRRTSTGVAHSCGAVTCGLLASLKTSSSLVVVKKKTRNTQTIISAAKKAKSRRSPRYFSSASERWANSAVSNATSTGAGAVSVGDAPTLGSAVDAIRDAFNSFSYRNFASSTHLGRLCTAWPNVGARTAATAAANSVTFILIE